MTIFTGITVEESIERCLYRLGVKSVNVHIHLKLKENQNNLFMLDVIVYISQMICATLKR